MHDQEVRSLIQGDFPCCPYILSSTHAHVAIVAPLEDQVAALHGLPTCVQVSLLPMKFQLLLAQARPK